MNTDDIFDRAEKETPALGEFFKFVNVGDKISGTFVDLMEGIDGYGNEQYIVVLRNSGINHRVSVRKTHSVLVDQLKQVRLGQIIGFKFIEERESKKAGSAKSKIINLAQVPGMVDDAWIAEKLAIDAKYGISPEDSLRPKFSGVATPAIGSAEDLPFPNPPAPVAAPVAPAPVAPAPVATPAPVAVASNPVFETIRNLAVTKGLAPEGSSAADVDAAIKNVTGFEMNDANTTAIIMKLSTTV